MKNKQAVFLIILLLLLNLCSGCASASIPGITMPYSSEEYVNGEWTIEDLRKHFRDLGFKEIEVNGNTTKVIGVYAENDDSLYDSFEKGMEIDSSRKIGIYTEFNFETTSTLSIANCPEFAELVESGIDSSEDWIAFLESHSGELLEFDGTITHWYDDMFWIGVSFTIAIEDSSHLSFSKDTIDLIELGLTGEYHYDKYHVGLINEGMRVHVITEIKQTEDGWQLELDSMQIIE